MGNKSNTAATPAVSSNTITSIPTTETTTTTTLSAAPITTSAPSPTVPVTVPTTTTAVTTSTAATTTTATATVTTPTPAITSTASVISNTSKTPVATVTTPTPTPAITSTASITSDISKTPASTEGTPKPTFYSVAKSLTSDADKAKSASSAYARWYKWSKFEQQKRDKGKILWYMGPPVTTTDAPSLTTTTLTMTTARIGDNQKEAYDPSNTAVVPSFQLRSTAIYSPPHGDRVPSGRTELINTDTSVFKYYLPENRFKKTVGIHTKATMYNMNTRLKQIPLPTQSSARTTDTRTNVTGDNSSLRTFVSRGLQTDLEVQPMHSSSTQMRYYEKQQPQIVPISAFSNSNSRNNGFVQLSPSDTISQPVLPPMQQPYPSVTQPFPSYPSPPARSILKNSSTVLSQDKPNPLSAETHDKVLEELRQRNKNTKDGTYRVKKIHLLEKSDPKHYSPTVSFNLPPPPPPPSSTKAGESIPRSEKLFFNQLFNRKK